MDRSLTVLPSELSVQSSKLRTYTQHLGTLKQRANKDNQQNPTIYIKENAGASQGKMGGRVAQHLMGLLDDA